MKPAPVLLYYKINNTEVVVEEIHNVLGDKTMFYEVFLNIIGNAIKYSSQAKHPKIEISSEINNKEVIFKIKDNGIGIKKKIIIKCSSYLAECLTLETFLETELDFRLHTE